MSLFLQNLFLRLTDAKQHAFPQPRVYRSFAETEPGFVPERAAYIVGVPAWKGGAGDEGRLVLAEPGEPLAPEDFARARELGAEGFYVSIPVPPELPKLLIYGALAVAALGLYVLVRHTRAGKAMRAVSHSHEIAALMGIPVGRIVTFTFFVGAVLAGAGGMLWGLRYGKVEALMGFLPGLKAFIAAVVGGIGSIPGAVLGGILLGVLEALCAGYLPDALTGYKDAVAFVALIIILLVKPSGLLGRFEGEKV